MARIKYDAIKQEALQKAITQVKKKTGLTEVGRIRVGEKVKNQYGKEMPASTDYFVIDSRYAKLLTDKYGEKPTELPVMFYSDNFEEVCNERLEIRDNAGKLVGYGDGEVFHIYNPKLGDYVATTTADRPDIMEQTRDYVCRGLPTDKAKLIGWVPVLCVRFAIKDVPVLGYWQFTTRAVKTTIPNLRDRFDECLATFGTVRFFPFNLTVKKAKSNKPGEARQYPVVDIVPGFSVEAGLKLVEFMQNNTGFNPAKVALMDLQNIDNEIKAIEGKSQLLIGPADNENISIIE